MKKLYQVIVEAENQTSRVVNCGNQVHELMVIDREDKKFISDHNKELEKPALYILVNRDRKQLYVGETEDSIKRLRNHKAKDFWTEALVFHSTTETLAATEVKWLEAKTYQLVKELGYYDLSENKVPPSVPKLKKYQDLDLIPILEEAKGYVCAAGFDIFLKKKEEKPSQQEIEFTEPETQLQSNKNEGPRYSSKPTLIHYYRSLKNETMQQLLKEIGIAKAIAQITDVKELEAIREQIVKKEKARVPVIHHTFSCAISKYIEYLEHGFTYQDLEHDALLVYKGRKTSRVAKKPKQAAPKQAKQQGKLQRKKPAPPFKFSMIDMSIGTTITFDPTGQQVKVISTDSFESIEYNGRVFSLTGFCKEFMPEEKRIPTNAYQGPAFFSYQGKTLKKIRKEKEKK